MSRGFRSRVSRLTCSANSRRLLYVSQFGREHGLLVDGELLHDEMGYGGPWPGGPGGWSG